MNDTCAPEATLWAEHKHDRGDPVGGCSVLTSPINLIDDPECPLLAPPGGQIYHHGRRHLEQLLLLPTGSALCAVM